MIGTFVRVDDTRLFSASWQMAFVSMNVLLNSYLPNYLDGM